MRVSRSVQLAGPAWTALATGGWSGPVRVRAGDSEYAGRVAVVDVDEDARVVGAHAQARRVGGWGGIAGRLELRPGGGGGGRVEIEGDVELSGEASEDAAEALVGGVAERVADAARAPAPAAPAPAVGASGADRAEPFASPADDPEFRRRLAGRAAMAVALGAALGLAGAAWGRRRP